MPCVRARGDQLSSCVEEVAGLVGRGAGGTDFARQDASRKSKSLYHPEHGCTMSIYIIPRL